MKEGDYLEPAPEMKEHIIRTTIQLLDNGFDMDALTIRKIASKSNVAIGSINYHFGSKDKLFLEVINRIVDRTQISVKPLLTDKHLPPRDRLIKFLLEMVEVIMLYKSQSKIMLRYEILSDSFTTPEHILDILHELRPEISEEELKWLSVLVVAPLQYIFMKEEGFKKFMVTQEFVTEPFIESHLKMLGL
jgi:AcrR family transcriptional regulator